MLYSSIFASVSNWLGHIYLRQPTTYTCDSQCRLPKPRASLYVLILPRLNRKAMEERIPLFTPYTGAHFHLANPVRVAWSWTDIYTDSNTAGLVTYSIMGSGNAMTGVDSRFRYPSIHEFSMTSFWYGQWYLWRICEAIASYPRA